MIIRRFLACLVILSFTQAALAGPIQNAITQTAWAPVQPRGWRFLSGNATIVSGVAMPGAGATVVLANTSMDDETVICSADAVLSCGYGSEPKEVALPWGLRLAGAGVALTILGANMSIKRGGFKVWKSVAF